jgi:hypothetical protein
MPLMVVPEDFKISGIVCPIFPVGRVKRRKRRKPKENRINCRSSENIQVKILDFLVVIGIPEVINPCSL